MVPVIIQLTDIAERMLGEIVIALSQKVLIKHDVCFANKRTGVIKGKSRLLHNCNEQR
jgi:hypothetical protein